MRSNFSYIIKIFIFLFITYSTTAQTITRGPYIQISTDTSIIIKWKSNIPTDTKLQYGKSFSNQNLVYFDSNLDVNHTVTLNNLEKESTYYYSIYGNNSLLEKNIKNYFKTPRPAGSTKKMRFWITGDCGTGTIQQTNVKNQFLNYIKTDTLDGWLLLGDNAYNSGLDAEYQSYFFQPYQNDRIMKETPILPCPGNHDYGNNSGYQSNPAMPYYSIFDIPKNGERSPVPSFTESYYSYNIGNIHFISLDSYGKETASNYKLSDTLGPQITWLKQDLAANTQKWTILYWHHPPYTMGSHNSDAESDLKAIRQNTLPLLERYHIDLILCGHSHNYERSKLIKGHFGLEPTYNPSIHEINSSSGFYDGSTNSCAYLKSSGAQNEGIVYVVAGAAGWNSGEQTAWPHNALPYSNGAVSGSMYLEVEGNRLDSKWIGEDGIVHDKFTIIKDVSIGESTLNLPKNATSVELTAPNKIQQFWNIFPNQKINKIQIENPINGMRYNISDSLGCFNYSYKIEIADTCKQSQSINSIIDKGSIINFKTSDEIIVSKNLLSPSNIKLDAAKKIVLEPGFAIKDGVFEAKIGGCVNNP